MPLIAKHALLRGIYETALASHIALISCRECQLVHISRFLHFQAGQFLAHYAAMCPSDASANNTDLVEPDAAHSENEQSAVASQLSTVPASVLAPVSAPVEIGGRDGPEPTRFGDWEKAGRCIDF